MSSSLLSLQGFGVAFGERVVLSSVNLEVPERDVLVLLGPAGTGKSTLLRSLAGFNHANPSFRIWGTARFAGAPLGEAERPALVAQSAKLMMSSVIENIVQDLPERRHLSPAQQRELAGRLLTEAGLTELLSRLDEPAVHLPLALQRHLAILRLAATGTRMLCVDEPTTGLDDNEALRLLDHLRQESARRTILLVLHNQDQARYIGGTAALLAGGMIQERQHTEAFLSAPQSAAGEDFVRTGSCALPAPDADPETLAPEVEPPPPIPPEAHHYVSDAFGPRGFLWLKKGRLAGTPRPGIFLDVDYDLKSLLGVGVTCLMSLTETPPDTQALKARQLLSVWFPIPDMEAPSEERAAEICRRIDALLSEGQVVAVHCRAGLGRTGTVLAAYLIWEGNTALAALEAVRSVEPRWVQSDKQVQFLSQFEMLCASWNRQDATQNRSDCAANY